MAKPKEEELRCYLSLDFTPAEIARIHDAAEKDVIEQLARLSRKDAKLAAAEAAPTALNILREPAGNVTQGKTTGDAISRGSSRPFPPEAMQDPDRTPERFAGAQDVRDWMIRTFISRAGKLHNPDHLHLLDAQLGVLWTNVPNKRGGSAIAGTAEKPMLQGGKWAKRRAEMYLELLLGGPLPDFLITLDSVYAAQCDDAEFCALCEHELYHCGQAADPWGAPKFSNATGLPIFSMRGHDVEEFVGVVERYGAGCAAGRTAELIDAAQGRPTVARAAITGACGTCRR